MEKKYKKIRELLINTNDKIKKIRENIEKYEGTIDFLLSINDNSYNGFIEDYNKMKKEDELLLNQHLEVKEDIEKKLDETGLYNNKDYRKDNNNIIDMKRDVNAKLSYYLSDDKKRQLFGVSPDYFYFKDSAYFKTLNKEPKLELTKYCKRIESHTFEVKMPFNIFSIFQGIVLRDLMPANSGIYLLVLKIIKPNTEMEIIFNGDTYVNNKKHKNDEEVFVNEEIMQDCIDVIDLPREWRVNDYLYFEIDTNEKKITYIVKYDNKIIDTKVVELFYIITEPLHVFINISNNNKIYLHGFGKFNN
jgi:hypothetical protein